MAEGDGAVGLAQANGTNEHDVGVGCDEGQTEQVLDLWSIDLLWPVPLEVFHRLEDGEAGVLYAPLDGAGLTAGGLAPRPLGPISGVGGQLLGRRCGAGLGVLLFFGGGEGGESGGPGP